MIRPNFLMVKRLVEYSLGKPITCAYSRFGIRPIIEGITKFSSLPQDTQKSPEVAFKGDIIFVQTDGNDQMAEEKLMSSAYGLIGLHLNFQKSNKMNSVVKTCQLASQDTAVIWDLSHIKSTFPKTIKAILENPSLIKVLHETSMVCHGALNSILLLRESYFVFPMRLLDLQLITNHLNLEEKSLQDMSRSFLRRDLMKETQVPNMCNSRLSTCQVKNAAPEAWDSREVLLALRRKFNVTSLKCEAAVDTSTFSDEYLQESALQLSHGIPENATVKMDSSSFSSEENVCQKQDNKVVRLSNIDEMTLGRNHLMKREYICNDIKNASSVATDCITNPDSSFASVFPFDSFEDYIKKEHTTPLAALTEICVKNNYRLDINGFSGEYNYLKCSFTIYIREETHQVVSSRAHSSMRKAQNDAAMEVLKLLSSL
ncbi:3'-5' exonuclease domain-containing protein [Cardiosporidium cionae]|uniref:3'-5' exonuclease domain-containing protein n=1 Tax=Cardiosporidium cionae TaxID=476202 RepID=A0ABQ7JEA0_9APIC|nr:3'-5' exonuclease domain-containing protein [Cardiosporidium cionae]|eukprot:KAF8822328.1 3'-5' exonuclease domain-containing protein [Cardiosporidium cionae]